MPVTRVAKQVLDTVAARSRPDPRARAAQQAARRFLARRAAEARASLTAQDDGDGTS